MSTSCPHLESVPGHALRALPRDEAARFEDHLAGCASCRAELAALRPVVEAFAHWPVDVLRPAGSLWERVAERTGTAAPRAPVAAAQWREPAWEEVAPGIHCKILARDDERARVSMLVRLDPGVEYPPHRHAGVEELHLLQGELWIDERKLHPGDYNRAEPGTADRRVWSQTGCTCVLIASPGDVLG